MTPSPDPTRRSARSRQAILDSVIALVARDGYEHVSIEAIAREAGVGKTTIYRWWRSKGEVVLEALDESLRSVVDFPDTGDVVADLRTQMTGVTQLLRTDVGSVYQGLIAAAQSDPDLSEAHLAQVIRPATVACLERLAVAQERGEIAPDVDRQAVIDLLYGALYYRLLLHTLPLDVDHVDALLRVTFGGAAPSAPRGTQPRPRRTGDPSRRGLSATT